MVKHDGNCAECNMIKFIKNILENALKDPFPIIEGKWADSYTDPVVIELIQSQYKDRWNFKPTPYTHPCLFNPMNPPKGWKYDPFYEEWVKVNE